MKRLTRRRFLLRAVMGAGMILPAIQGIRSAQAALSLTPHQELIIALFRHRESARHLGRAYLNAHPEADPMRLLDRVADSAGGRLSFANPDSLRQALAAACSTDFRAGRVVQVEGWLLAESEAQACALVALRG